MKEGGNGLEKTTPRGNNNNNQVPLKVPSGLNSARRSGIP